MGSYKWGYKTPNMGYKYSYPTYNLPMNLQLVAYWVFAFKLKP